MARPRPMSRLRLRERIDAARNLPALTRDDLLAQVDTTVAAMPKLGEVAMATEEVLDLGTFTDFDRLFDVLSLAADHAADWEEQLVPFDEDEFDEPDVYDIFGADDIDDADEDDLDDDDEDFDDEDDEDDDER